MSPETNNCKSLYLLLDAYHDEELDSVERSQVEAHLSDCNDCQSKLSDIERVVSSLKNLPQMQMARDLNADLSFVKEALAITAQNAEEETVRRIAKKSRAGLLQMIIKRSFPIPGPVIFAGASAAAAITLLVTVPRLLNTPNPRGDEIIADSRTDRTSLATVQKHSEPLTLASNADLNSHIVHSFSTTSERGRPRLAHQPGNSSSFLDRAPARSFDTTPETNSVTGITPLTIPVAETRLLENDQTPDDHDAPTLANTDNGDTIALYPSDPAVPVNELAVSTDEDGLYALKL
jgi:hypothetical protein